MKTLLFIFPFITSTLSAQVSYDFAQALPPYSDAIKTVNSAYFGNYSNSSSDIEYEINSQGIFAVSTIISKISRETVRESSTYNVRNGYIFGVKENDSLPYILEDEFYYFGIKFHEMIISSESLNKLTKVNHMTYIINFEENGHYTPSLFEFKEQELHVRHFTYDDSTTIFDQIKNKTTNEPNQTITLSPSTDEWEKFPLLEILGDRIIFNRRAE